jgi:hypothetical protein
MTFIQDALSWLSANWGLVCLVAFVLIQVLQKATKHFSEYKGFVKVALFVVDCLSVLSSRGNGSLLKPPGPSKAPEKPQLPEKPE